MRFTGESWSIRDISDAHMMILPVVVLIFLSVAEGQVTLLASDNFGKPVTCIPTGTSAELKLICRVEVLSGFIVFKKNGTVQSQCSSSSGACLPPSVDGSRYTFTSDLNKKEFYFSISQFKESDVSNYTCLRDIYSDVFSANFCQNGTIATSSPPATTTSTTSGATTMTSTVPTSKTATTTKTTLPNTTNPATTTATSPKVSTTTTSSTSPTPKISASTTTHATITTRANTGAEDSDKGLIALIIVVSVIGGILVIAIIFMLFLLGHWKICSVQKGQRKHIHHSSHRYIGHRTQKMKRKHTTTKGRAEHSTFQPHHKSGDYSFYRDVRNPVFDKTLDKSFSQDVYNRNTSEIIHTPQYNEPPPGPPYGSNWEEMW